MCWGRCRPGAATATCILLALAAITADADEDEEDDRIEDELEALEESDFPDLVEANEESALMDEFALLEEADVVQTAARHRQKIGMSPSAVTVITREDIETSGASTLPDLLRLVPGMDVIRSSPFYAAVTARLYWTYENNHFLVLIDGREANLEMVGQAPWEIQPISIEDIERIEVIRGPASSLYGANAVAGVITITTRGIPERSTVRARLVGGEMGALRANTMAAARMGDWGFAIHGGFDRTGSFGDPRLEGKRVWKLRTLAEYRWSRHRRLLFEGGLSQATGPMATPIGSIGADLSIRTLRLSCRAEQIEGQIVWTSSPVDMDWSTPLSYKGVLLAQLEPSTVRGDAVDGQVQWNVPTFWDPLLLIAGGGARVNWMRSDEQLDARNFNDITSKAYHQRGISHVELRTGAFIHGELSPADWVTVTAGTRFDYNNDTGAFVSPRLAAVFRLADNHHLRAGVARAFRKPAYLELNGHIAATFPEDSPIQGAAQDEFLEFLTRVSGNLELDNEKLLSFEAGYLGHFLDERLRISLDLYFNRNTDVIFYAPDIRTDAQGLPDLQSSTMQFENQVDLDIAGAELAIRYLPVSWLCLQASYAHRELLSASSVLRPDESPKNLITLGARLHNRWGLVGSLFVFSRSKFWDRGVENPAGILEPLRHEHMDNQLLIMGRLGWRWKDRRCGLRWETGTKLLLPIAPWSDSRFGFREQGGGITASGRAYGGRTLTRQVGFYLQGTYQ